MREHITRDEAKQIIDSVQGGYVVVGRRTPIPFIGSVPPENMKYEHEICSYRFGEFEDIKK